MIKVLYSPDHFDIKSGQLSSAVIQISDLQGTGRTGSGFSVARKGCSTAADLRARILQLALDRDTGRSEMGAMMVQCAVIREIVDGERLLCINDDGVEDKPWHALVVFSEATKTQGFWASRQPAWQKKRVRQKLVDKFVRMITIEDCFQ